MHDSQSGSIGEALMLFLAGAAVGGLLVAMNTPKTGTEFREDLKGLGRRAQRKASGLAEDVEGAWERLKETGEETAESARRKAADLTS